jgi:imidazolonepropionase-like amidohydrolase
MADILFRNLALLDVDAGALRARHEVLVRGERIVAVSEGRIDAPGARVIDLGGRTLMPGLIDCHVHICADGMTPYPTIFPAMLAGRAAKTLRETLMRGFTTLRDAGGADMGYRQAVEAGLFPGPRLFVAGRPISQTGGHGDSRHQADPCVACECRQNRTMFVIADGVDAVRAAVREEIRRGADQIKIMASGGVASPADPIDYVQYSMDELHAIVDEARRAKKYVMAHAYTAEAIDRAVEAGVRTIEHGNFIDEAIAAKMAARGAYLVPTLIVYRRILTHGREVGVSELHLEKARQVHDVGTRSLAIAKRAGVKMAFGTDLFRAPKEYQAEEFLVRAEVLSPAEIIRSATVIGAEVVRMDGQLGRVALNHLADLLVVDGDPLSDLRLLQDQGAHLSLIMKNGEIVKSALT